MMHRYVTLATVLTVLLYSGCVSTDVNSNSQPSAGVSSVSNSKNNSVAGELVMQDELNVIKTGQENNSVAGELVMQVEEPELHNIASGSEWIPEFVVNTISDDIAKYSNIIIADNRNAKKMAQAQKRDEGALFDDDDLVEAGNFKVAKKVLFVSITGKGDSCALSVRINDKEKNTSIAAYSDPNCTFADLESGLAIKEAVADLLDQLGFTLSQSQKESLLSVKAAKTMQAQKLAAQGNIAIQNGSTLEALQYYLKANAADVNLQTALQSMSLISTVLTKENVGNQAREIMKRRNEYKKLFAAMEQNFRDVPPYVVIIKSEPKMGKIDYEKETCDIVVEFALVADVAKKKLFNSVRSAFEKEPDSQNWGIEPSYDWFNAGLISLNFEVQDKNGNVLGSAVKTIDTSSRVNPVEHFYYEQFNMFNDWYTGSDYFGIPVSASADTENLRVVIKNSNIRQMSADDYVNNVFIKQFAVEEIADGVYAFTFPYRRTRAYVNVKAFCNAFTPYRKFNEDTVLNLVDAVLNKGNYRKLPLYESSSIDEVRREHPADAEKLYEYLHSPGFRTKNGNYSWATDCPLYEK